MLRVVIYESSPIFLKGLLIHIKRKADLKVVESFAAETDVPPWLTDLFLVDVDITGVQALAGFTAKLMALAPVVVLAHTSLSSADVANVVEVGASGVVDKRVSPKALLEVMRGVASGCRFISPGFEVETRTPQRRASNELSGRGQQVLDMIARGLTHHQIARLMLISSHTVDTYVKRIKAKLNLGNKAELTRVAVLRSITT